MSSIVPILVAHDATCPKGEEWVFHHFPKGDGPTSGPEDANLGCIVASLVMLALVIASAVRFAAYINEKDNSKEDAKMSEQSIAVAVPTGKAKCTMCGGLFDDEPIKTKDSDLCPECRKKYGGMAFIYCNKCKAIVTRIPTGMAMGILIKPYDILHVNECPQCTKGVIKSIPLEVEQLRFRKE